MKKIVFATSLLLLILSSCGLQNDLKTGFKVFSKVSKEFDCLENSFSVNTTNGVKNVDVKLKCKDETGMYNGRVLLEVHRQLKKEGMKVDNYNLELTEENKSSIIAAKDLDLGLVLEEKALMIKEKFQQKKTDFILENSDEDLVRDIERQDLFKNFDSLIQSSYPNYTGFNWNESSYQFGFEQDGDHFLILMFNPKTKKLNGIRFN